jgi:hypothetical protein
MQSDKELPKVIISLSGGLGNQLFQYAMGRALSLRNGLPLVLDLTWFDYVKNLDSSVATLRKYALEPFELNVITQSSSLLKPKIPKFLRSIVSRLQRYIPHIQKNQKVYTERGFAFDEGAYSLQKPVRLDGYWQSPRYFEDCADLIRSELGKPRSVSAATKEMLERIRGVDAICLHIRRGDYISNKSAASMHGLCGLEYYLTGLEQVCDGLVNPHCFIFSDDPIWVKENMQLAVPMTIVDINGPDAAHEDLWLMSACKRFVIANSSLSWWGAWLSEHMDKVIVAPSQWFLTDGINTDDLIPKDWVRI